MPGSKEARMFDIVCPHCERHVLLTPRRILCLRNTAEGIEVAFRCWCGGSGVWVTGRRAGDDTVSPPAFLRLGA
jgi:hypothetical protein